MRDKIILVLIIALAIVCYLHKPDVKQIKGTIVALPTKIEVARKGLTITTNPIVVKKINKRGDLKITPTTGKIVASEPQYFAKDEEVAITINVENTIPMKLNRNKFGASYSIYENKVFPVWMYESVAMGNCSLNFGISNGGLIAIGNALSMSMEDYVGVSFGYGRSPDVQFGFTVRF